MSKEPKEESKNDFDVLKSKIQDLHIPLPNFKKFFHKPSSEDEVFENFIGREDISEQLEKWLVDGDSGSYLVTGYRGMGKSSFVGKVLNKITIPKSSKKALKFDVCCILLVLIYFLLAFYYCCIHGLSRQLFPSWCLWFPTVVIMIIVIFFILNPTKEYWLHKRRKKFGIGQELGKKIGKKIDKELGKKIDKNYENHKTWFENVYGIKELKNSKHNLVIKLDLGHEVLREKDILCLLTKRIYETYKEYSNNFYTNWIRILLNTILCISISIITVGYFAKREIIDNILGTNDLKQGNVIFVIIGNITKFFRDHENASIIVNFILAVAFYFIVKKIFNFLILQIPFLRKFSRTEILGKLKFLIDRTEAAVTEESGPNSGYFHSPAQFSLNFGRRKNKSYPIASTREIEDELIQILDKIKAAEWGVSPKFIIVFDELDKIDPIYNHVLKTEQNIPEFEASMAFQGGSAIRDRKQNVLKLLGNMKMFMSEANAKFIFISGRELYDAYLADLADREFAASSIFNGVIYVDSFLESSVKEKDILTKTEEYICRYLIPEKWYKKTAREEYETERGINSTNNNKGKKMPDMLYRKHNLRWYKQFLLETLIENSKDSSFFSSYSKDLMFRDYEEFEEYFIMESCEVLLSKDSSKDLILNYYEKKLKHASYTRFKEKFAKKHIKIISGKNRRKIYERELSDIKQKYLFIDKVIVFLKQFSIYLTYVCNGSPKKITLYFENYIKSFIYAHNKNLFSRIKDEDKAIEKSKYCLSFSANDQQNISFVQYMTYPIIQSLINQTSHFGDKMLVSISFLINHILKHHMGGFSNENIEHTPELLEVYHIPNLRNIIDSILSFLRQNHVTDICGGVYQYKFRKPIADEIMYNSRISKEISAIFNFTLDESLSVKRYYYKHVEDNEKKYLALLALKEGKEIESKNLKNQYAATLISQLEILSEIHFLDEEYNEAIQNFQTALEIIKSELQNCKEEKDKLQLYVLLNRVVLKLGLAKECKGYYNEALALYNNLLDYIIEFRNLKEFELGLNYFYEDNNITNPDGEWKTKKTKLFHYVYREYYCDRTKTKRLKDAFFENDVLPSYRQNSDISHPIDFLVDGDYIVSGLSKMLSSKKQEIISRIALFSETRSIYQAILANLFVVEKIDVNGITQENLDLAEDQFKYIYLLTNSKDKFIQAADFYRKLASILFLKNYSALKADEYIRMWGFDIRETINEFCFINSEKYIGKTGDKFLKEILTEFFIVSNDDKNLWGIIERNDALSLGEYADKRHHEIIKDFQKFSWEKRGKHIKDDEVKKCKECWKSYSGKGKNNPCHACSYASKSLDIFKKVFEYKHKELFKSAPDYKIRKSYFFKFLQFLKQAKTANNHLFILASTLRIKADVSLSCANKDDKLNPDFLCKFLDLIEDYYNKSDGDVIDPLKVENMGQLSKLENAVLYYWLASEYFYKNSSLVDSNECLSKILMIFDKYLMTDEELSLVDIKYASSGKFFLGVGLFKKIQDTIVRRVFKNNNAINNNVDHIEVQNLKYILNYRQQAKRINRSFLSAMANVEEILFPYCKLELNSIKFEEYFRRKESEKSEEPEYPICFDCYTSRLLSGAGFLGTSTLSAKISSLEFKERMNMAIFKAIFEDVLKKDNEKLNFYDYDFQIKYFSFLVAYLNNNGTCDERIWKLYKIPNCESDHKTMIKRKIDALMFLISDSLYCLVKIIEILPSGMLSNFSYSFTGDIYHQISKWATLYQLTYAVLGKYYERSEKDIEIFQKREIEKMHVRKNDFGITDKEFGNKIKKFYENIEDVSKKFKIFSKDSVLKDNAFTRSILNDIGEGNRHFLVPNYSIAMALKYYHKAIELHSEGKEYREMMREMYIIDDDISNGMHCFSLALERYAMNRGLIEEKMQKLRIYYKDSLSYPLTYYLEEPPEPSTQAIAQILLKSGLTQDEIRKLSHCSHPDPCYG